jgi:hypothetical protein
MVVGVIYKINLNLESLYLFKKQHQNALYTLSIHKDSAGSDFNLYYVMITNIPHKRLANK